MGKDKNKSKFSNPFKKNEVNQAELKAKQQDSKLRREIDQKSMLVMEHQEKLAEEKRMQKERDKKAAEEKKIEEKKQQDESNLKKVGDWVANFRRDNQVEIESSSNNFYPREMTPEENNFLDFLNKNYVGKSAFTASGLPSDKATLLLMYKKDPKGLDAALTKVERFLNEHSRSERIIGNTPDSIYQEMVAHEVYSVLKGVMNLEERKLIQNGKFEMRLATSSPENDLTRLNKFADVLKNFGFNLKVIEDKSGRHKFVFQAENINKVKNLEGLNADIMSALEKDKNDQQRIEEIQNREKEQQAADQKTKVRKLGTIAANAAASKARQKVAVVVAENIHAAIGDLIPIGKKDFNGNELNISINRESSRFEVVKAYMRILQSKGYDIEEKKVENVQKWIIKVINSPVVDKEVLKDNLESDPACKEYFLKIGAEKEEEYKRRNTEDEAKYKIKLNKINEEKFSEIEKLVQDGNSFKLKKILKDPIYKLALENNKLLHSNLSRSAVNWETANVLRKNGVVIEDHVMAQLEAATFKGFVKKATRSFREKISSKKPIDRTTSRNVGPRANRGGSGRSH